MEGKAERTKFPHEIRLPIDRPGLIRVGSLWSSCFDGFDFQTSHLDMGAA